jgi:hypothetical protein
MTSDRATSNRVIEDDQELVASPIVRIPAVLRLLLHARDHLVIRLDPVQSQRPTAPW